MLLWRNSDGVYNFIIIGSIVPTCLCRGASCGFRGTAILISAIWFYIAICEYFISQYASPSGSRAATSDMPTPCESTSACGGSHTFASINISRICTRPDHLRRGCSSYLFFSPHTYLRPLTVAIFPRRYSAIANRYREPSRGTRFAALSKSFEINAKHMRTTRGIVGLRDWHEILNFKCNKIYIVHLDKI